MSDSAVRQLSAKLPALRIGDQYILLAVDEERGHAGRMDQAPDPIGRAIEVDDAF